MGAGTGKKDQKGAVLENVIVFPILDRKRVAVLGSIRL